MIAATAHADGGVLASGEVIFLGEQHDNPAHHTRQAEIVGALAPRALVFEMLTPEQAGRITPGLIAEEDALEAALGWNASGWPDFSMYYPIFAAAPEATYFGAAVPREAARAAMEAGPVASFGPEAARYGLDRALPPEEQSAREALQAEAHCDALPEEMLPVMVEIQRLRDARLAEAALMALQAAGPPVAVITGNGHARPDWGAPALLARAAPGTRIATFGQSETGGPPLPPGFDRVEEAPPVDRGDPCAAFR
ncbi:ChaN family lipoprotein [Roseivivax sp. GX 12232]|nr:ChaN family lipoprotein [Roseivivax sp. GX 12232]MCE0505204.1 ChaN family lipoprotein [Roseivivax sp. GX 12232]